MEHLNWRRLPSHAGVPGQLRPWLTDEGSLTARIKRRCKQFQVRVLREGMALPHESERRQVGLKSGTYAWVREVLLLADGRPVVFAHSVAARQDLRGAWRMAAGIGVRPLGQALFADPSIEREPIQMARIATENALHRRIEQTLGATLPLLWARRSRFMHSGRPLLVMEIFLPGIASLG